MCRLTAGVETAGLLQRHDVDDQDMCDVAADFAADVATAVPK
ncbi:hypothetical protein QQM39_16870 [Streptomyces sp. DT2A-34]|nr:hypothetical protein [Streptomyces sp. DT2A-34]MDO0912462.1 hypothetical protein [Streptomyces sp. DT2A-34]